MKEHIVNPDQPQPLVSDDQPTTTGSGSHPRKFDRQTYNQISGLEARLLELLDFDCRQQAKRSKTGAKYSIKPEAWLAKCLQVSRETISIRVNHLAEIGILEITHRSPVGGRWQTNLYKFRSWVWWRMARALRALRSRHNRVRQPSHLSISKKREVTRKEGIDAKLPSTTGEILSRWLARGTTATQAII